MKITRKTFLVPALAGLALLGGAGAGIASIASAQSSVATTDSGTNVHTQGRGLGVVGTIAAINGSTITLTDSNGKTYTVDASAAEVQKISTINVAGLAVGDTLMVGGSVNGTSVTAKHIMDGAMPVGEFMGHGGPRDGKGPGVVGTVSAIQGTTLMVAGKDGTTYTVDATNAKIGKHVEGQHRKAEGSLSDIKVGDSVGVMGVVSGTTVTAEHIMDGLPLRPEGARKK